MGRSAFEGDDDEDRQETQVEPYNIMNTLTLRSNIHFWFPIHTLELPALTTLKGFVNFRWFGHLIYNGMHTSLIICITCRCSEF